MSKECFIKQQDVYHYGGSSSINGRGNKPRQSRALDIRSFEMNLVHKPTQIEVKGVIPAGNYSRKEMMKLKEELYRRLFMELDSKVAKALKLPRR